MLPSFLCAQSSLSDLERSDHNTKYMGDSTLMAPLLEMLRKDYERVIVPREQLCSEKVSEVGEIVIKEETYLIVYQESGIGHSCRGISNLLIFKNGHFTGFYRSDLDLNFWIQDGQLCSSSLAHDSSFDRINLSSGWPTVLPILNGLPYNNAAKYEKHE